MISRPMITGAVSWSRRGKPSTHRSLCLSGDPRYSPENFPLNLRLAERISELAKAKGITPAAFCLAWVLYQGENVIAIPGTKSIDRLKQNLEAGRVLESFTKEDDAAVRDITSQLGVVGDRYGEVMMGWINN